ncbi:hypothetical protein AB835_04105 [Candidatus Endobugula sertula]|uniref:Glycosyl transferase family 1 n=1 Tax=Candidatus Endobugula sertula TaxID=62101 RepID=A0A1D2QS42_9GAMM|nr:hypothetical protein AB835_04105 [Candidatus Endobugula sertula]
MPERKYHIVHTESSGGWGGQEIRILNEAHEFIKRGHQVTLVVSTGSPIAQRSKEYQIPTVELPIGKKTLKGLFALCNWIAHNDFDVINTHSSSDSWMVALGMRLTFKHKPLIRTRHVSAPVSKNWATSWLYQTASYHIVTTGEKLRQTLINDNAIHPDKITSVPTGIDCQQFIPTTDKTRIRKQLKLPSDKTIIGIVATLRSWKGHQYLIEAFHQLGHHKTHLLIVGNGPQWSNIQQQIDQFGIKDNVTLCGEQSNVTPWLQAMDIFCLPSYANEGVPQSIMQAMACGLPIISTNVGSITEIVNENTGIIVESKDSLSLKAALLDLINNEKIRVTLGNNAINFSKKHCNINTMIGKMEIIFNQSIKNSPPKSFEKKQYIIFLTKGDQVPSFRYRLAPLITELEKRQYTCHTERLASSKYLWRLWKNKQLYQHASIIILHKLLLPKVEVDLLRTFCSTIILDIDDAIYLKKPRWTDHLMPYSTHKGRKFQYLISKCNVSIAGNHELGKKISSLGGKAKIISTGIDVNGCKKERVDTHSLCKIVWIGLPTNLKYLQMLHTVFATLTQTEPQFILQIICSHFPNWEDVRLEKVIWSKDTEKQYLANADIGIMPLDNSESARGKCAFKLLQYMAASLPCIASPVGANSYVVEDGKTGYLVNSKEEWIEKISLLIHHPQQRKDMGRKGLLFARSKYDQNTIAKTYANYITQLLKI